MLSRSYKREDDLQRRKTSVIDIGKKSAVISPAANMLTTFPQRFLGRVMGLHHFDRIYHALLLMDQDKPFLENLLEYLKVDYTVPAGMLERIPNDGPLIIASNHPFGGLDGVILLSVLSKIRPDIKAMANYILGRINELADHFILVDPFENRRSIAANISPMREAIRWLMDGKALILFPAGEVSHITWNNRNVVDPDWELTIARIVKKTRATVMSAFFHGYNSLLFQLLGLVHPMLRTAMLPREFIKQAGKPIMVKFGSPLPYEALSVFRRNKDMVDFLRRRTYMLNHIHSGDASTHGTQPAQPLLSQEKPKPIIDPLPRKEIEQELSGLPEDCRLVDDEGFQVFQAFAGQIPVTLMEIGRLREVSFRLVGEGTGKPIDIDKFDDYYRHLFLWDKSEKEIVGAYRIGQTDEILAARGKKGLYTHTLFDFQDQFLSHVTPGLEMGRSFIRMEYQKSFKPLMLLWKGIGVFVCRHPHYNILFGPVSITRDYLPISRYLISEYFNQLIEGHDIAEFVTPRSPLNIVPESGWNKDEALHGVKNVSQLSNIVSEFEPDNKGIPILMKHYLKLGGKIIAFNVDNDFGNCLDGMILVDLAKTDRKKLERYMGKEPAEDFLNYHLRPKIKQTG